MNWSANLLAAWASDRGWRKWLGRARFFAFRLRGRRPALDWRPPGPATRLSRALRRGGQTLGAAGLALFTHATANLPEIGFKPSPDPRFVRLERFFRHYRCPAPQYAFEYIRAADRYGLDYRILPALSIRETQCGLTETQNNRWGYHSGRQGFSSIEAGINFMARQLADRPPYKGKTLREKLWSYNPLPDYPAEVAWIMRQIE